MSVMGAINYGIYYSFLNRLARDLSSFYFKKVNKTFSVTNKHKGTGYDPVEDSYWGEKLYSRIDAATYKLYEKKEELAEIVLNSNKDVITAQALVSQ